MPKIGGKENVMKTVTNRILKVLLGGVIFFLGFALDTQATAQSLPNGGFETGNLSGWTSGSINNGSVSVVTEGTCWSSFDTRGITMPGVYAANVRSSGPAPTDSVGILTSNSFVASKGVSFYALSERSSPLQANPVNFVVNILAVPSGNIISTQIVGTNLITISQFCNAGPVGPNWIFSNHSIDTSAVFGQNIQIEFRQNTNISGLGFFTLVDRVRRIP